MDPATLPEPFRAGFDAIKQRCPAARLDAVKDNFAYIWIEPVNVSAADYKEPRPSGAWTRIPLQFPNAQPHGVITKEALQRVDGRAINGNAGRHEICGPVQDIGGVNYYSWTWNGNLGPGPTFRKPTDMTMVVDWVERRIRIA